MWMMNDDWVRGCFHAVVNNLELPPGPQDFIRKTTRIILAKWFIIFHLHLDFPEIFGDFPYYSPPFGGENSCEVAS